LESGVSSLRSPSPGAEMRLGQPRGQHACSVAEQAGSQI
jgi:hypothetical protein